MKDNLYTRMYLWLVAHRRSVLVATVLVMAAAAWFSSRIDLQEDILDMLPRNDQQVDEYRYALQKFRQIDRVYLDIGINTDDPETQERVRSEDGLDYIKSMLKNRMILKFIRETMVKK